MTGAGTEAEAKAEAEEQSQDEPSDTLDTLSWFTWRAGDKRLTVIVCLGMRLSCTDPNRSNRAQSLIRRHCTATNLTARTIPVSADER